MRTKVNMKRRLFNERSPHKPRQHRTYDTEPSQESNKHGEDIRHSKDETLQQSIS
jgi:hypothetical protein